MILQRIETPTPNNCNVNNNLFISKKMYLEIVVPPLIAGNTGSAPDP